MQTYINANINVNKDMDKNVGSSSNNHDFSDVMQNFSDGINNLVNNNGLDQLPLIYSMNDELSSLEKLLYDLNIIDICKVYFLYLICYLLITKFILSKINKE